MVQASSQPLTLEEFLKLPETKPEARIYQRQNYYQTDAENATLQTSGKVD